MCRARLTLELALNMAGRRGDVHKIGPQHIDKRLLGMAPKQNQTKHRPQGDVCPSCRNCSNPSFQIEKLISILISTLRAMFRRLKINGGAVPASLGRPRPPLVWLNGPRESSR
jgi:hypothetical protein